MGIAQIVHFLLDFVQFLLKILQIKFTSYLNLKQQIEALQKVQKNKSFKQKRYFVSIRVDL